MVFLLAALHDPAGIGRRVYAVLALLPLAFGLAVGGRHLWLQSLPPEQVPACGPSIDYMIEAFPLGDVLAAMTQGTGDCAAVSWQFILTLPGWALVGFAAILVLSVLQIRAGNQWGSAYRS